MADDLAAVRESICGSKVFGEYPRTDVDHVSGLVSLLARMKKAAKVTAPLTGTTEPPVKATPKTVLEELRAQTGERWQSREDGRWRTLDEAWRQVSLDLAVLGDVVPTPGAEPEPKPPVTPTPSSWPPKGAAWAASWDSSDPRDGGKFKSAPWNWQSATPTVRQGRLHIELLPGGVQQPASGAERGSGSRRCELEPNLPESVTPKAGRTVWHRWDVTLVNFPTDTTKWSVLTQWKQDGTGSPPVELSVERNRWKLIIHDSSGTQTAKHDVGPAEQSKAITLVIGVTFGPSGHLVAYLDGVKTLDVATQTMHAGKGSYLKSPGIYADAALSGPLCVEVDRMAVGLTLASVTS